MACAGESGNVTDLVEDGRCQGLSDEPLPEQPPEPALEGPALDEEDLLMQGVREM